MVTLTFNLDSYFSILARPDTNGLWILTGYTTNAVHISLRFVFLLLLRIIIIIIIIIKCIL